MNFNKVTMENTENGNFIFSKNRNKKEEEEKNKRITQKFLKKLLRSDIKLYYSTPKLNETLYLHYNGFMKLENLEQFTELKVLYIEGNCIEKLENLNENLKLKCLYIQENLISKIENLKPLFELVSLNLNDNMISTIENLKYNINLENLQLKRNRIGINGLKDVEHLRELKNISALDLSSNFIDCENFQDFIDILKGMDSLAVLYMQGNPVCKKIPNYRKTLIFNLSHLKYLDDRPVFSDDRRYAEAFCKFGYEGERKERDKIKQEKAEEHRR